MSNGLKFVLFVCLTFGFVSYSCNGRFDKTYANKAITISPGEALYKQYCQSCHKPDGSGVPDLYPSLYGEKIKGNKDTLIRIVLLDIEREAIVREGNFKQEMPGQNYLTNHEIAFITNFIRKEFGGIKDSISVEEVEKIRKGLVPVN